MDHVKLSDMLKIIPKENYKKSDVDKRKKYCEWCLKKYLIEENIYVTISVDMGSGKPVYIDRTGDRILFELDDMYDHYIIDEFYWYADPILRSENHD